MSGESSKNAIRSDDLFGHCGLKLLYPGIDPVVDIIAIHGLNGHREKTWTTDNAEVLWLRDLLPHEIPNVRVWTWGYQLKELNHIANELISEIDVVRKRDDTDRRPIVFIAHDIGGVVLKSALLRSERCTSDSPEIGTPLALSTHGIIFMGTQHQKAINSSLLFGIYNSLKQKDKHFPDFLQDSHYLRNQNSEFLGLFSKKLDMCCMYGTIPTSKIIVSSRRKLGYRKKYFLPEVDVTIGGIRSIAIKKSHFEIVKFSSLYDQGFRIISNEIALMTMEAVRAFNLRINIPFSVPFSLEGIKPVPRFVSRVREMKSLEKALLPEVDNKHQNVIAIAGKGGAGKSQLAFEFAIQHQARFSAIFPLRGRTRGILKASIANIAHRIPPGQISEDLRHSGEPESTQSDEIVKAVFQWLGQKGNKRWLLIYDDIEDLGFQELKELMPQTDQGSIILTTRWYRLRRQWNTIDISERMTASEGLKLLTSILYVPKQDIPNAIILINKLSGLPLAIKQAALYMKATRTSIMDYMIQFPNPFLSLGEKMVEDFSSTYGFFNKWRVSYDDLTTTNQNATKLLQLLAYFEKKDIWYDLFSFDENLELRNLLKLPPWFKTIIHDRRSFYRTISLLHLHSLVQSANEFDTYTTSPINQIFIYDILNEKERSSLLCLAIISIGFAVPKRKDQSLECRLLPHADRCLHHLANIRLEDFAEFDSVVLCYALANLGTLYLHQNKLDNAMIAFEKVLVEFDKRFCPENSLSLSIGNRVALVYQQQGRLDLAEETFTRVLKGSGERHGYHDVLTIEITQNLESLYRAQGRTAEAERFLENVQSAEEEHQSKQSASEEKNPSTEDTINGWLQMLAKVQDEDRAELEIPESSEERGEDLETKMAYESDESDDQVSLWSKNTKSSSTTIDPTVEWEAAIALMVSILLGDNDISNLIERACSLKSDYKIRQSGARLLKWLGKRLMVMAKSPIEKEAARFLHGHRHDIEIMQRMIQEAVREEVDETNNQSSEIFADLRQENLEKYLQQRQSGFRTPPVPLTGNPEMQANENESDSSSDGAEDEDEGLLKRHENLERVKEFIVMSDAFLRFKDDLRDYVSPFEDSGIWNREKVLWEGQNQVRFERYVDVQPPSLVDKWKLFVQKMAGAPVRWWPLSQPMEYLEKQLIRIIWPCTCGNEIYIHVPRRKAQSYRRRLSTNPPEISVAAGGSSLPSNTNPNLGNTNSWTASASEVLSNLGSTIRQRFKNGRPAGSSTIQFLGQARSKVRLSVPTPRYIHWCVDSATRRTVLHHICIEEKRGKAFVEELQRSYRTLRGWKWWFSILTCTEIRMRKFVRVFSDEEIVKCSPNHTPLPDRFEHRYKYIVYPSDLDEDIHVTRAQAALIEYFHGHKCCQQQDRFEKLILSVPHRVTGNYLEKEEHAIGWGIHAQQGYSVSKVLTLLALTQAGPLVFAAWWLFRYNHHDLQNAFQPALYMFALLTFLVAIPDIYFR